MLRAIIFDVDGTLAETEEYHRLAFNQAFAEAGLPWVWEPELYRALLKVTGGKERIRAYAEDHAPAKADWAIEHVAELHAAKNAIYAGFMRDGKVRLRPGIEALVRAAVAAGLKRAIATTTSPENVAALLEATLPGEGAALFPVIAAGSMARAKKPAPDIYEIACGLLDEPAANCLALEDSRNGILSARAAGLKVAAVRSFYCGQDDLTGADAVFEDSAALALHRLRPLV